MADGWLVIPNWEKWQSRRDRHDPWLKTYTDQLTRDEYLMLTLAERGLLHDIRLAFATANGLLRTQHLHGYIQATPRQKQLDRLVNAGFLTISAAKPPPIGGSRARRSKEVDRDSPKSPHQKNSRGPKRTGYRMARGTHGVSYIRDPDGTDVLPPGYSG